MDLNDRYFNWVFDLVGHRESYRKLLMHLNDVYFEYQLEMDGNRFADGVDLRYRFGYEMQIDDRQIAKELDVRPCTILELMAALALRCEETIMADPQYGSRLAQWFWSMIGSLGLTDMDNEHFNPRHVDAVIRRFNARRYSGNGRGGLFTVDGYDDFPNIEIWKQMYRYLNEIGG